MLSLTTCATLALREQDATGDIIAVFSNPTAMINYPGDARTNDEVWSANPGVLPAKGAPVRITSKPCNE